MKRMIFIFLCIVMLLLLGCQEKVDTQADVEAIKKVIPEINQAYSNQDYEFLASCYLENAVRMHPNIPALVGRDNIRANFKEALEKYEMQITNLIEDVRVTGDYAFVRGSATAKLTPKSGGDPIRGTSKWMTFLQRQPDGSWKIVSDIWNRDHPNPLQPQD
jgi:uncharacterized protein (TIGR02246 family)